MHACINTYTNIYIHTHTQQTIAYNTHLNFSYLLSVFRYIHTYINTYIHIFIYINTYNTYIYTYNTPQFLVLFF